MTMELRPYQREAVAAILRELATVRATLLVLATGLGKTVAFAEVARRIVAEGARVLVLAHRGELLEQAASTLGRFGLTVGIEQAERRAGDVQVVVASVQTMRGKRLESFAPDAFGLVIVDESHHAPARSYRAVLDHFQAARVLGVTATPDRTDGTGLGSLFESVAYRMEIGAGIREGWLAPVELRSVVVEHLDLSGVRTVAGELVAAEVEAEMLDVKVLHEVAAPLAELARGRQTVLFAAGVAQARALAQTLTGYGVSAAAVHGSMPAEERARVLADYREGRVQVVANAMLLTEGFDCPETSCIALVRPTRSRALVAQMIGRGTRLAPEKASCLVVDFVPERTGSIRLAAPADALAGHELPDDIATHVRALSKGEATDALAEVERMEAEAAAVEAERRARVEAEQRDRIARADVQYALVAFDVDELLQVVSPARRPEDAFGWPEKRASDAQVEALRKAGVDVPDALTARQARALFDALNARRARGLCTLKQAKRLRSYGLRDDVSFDAAGEALDAIAKNGWKPPAWLFRDRRFAREVAA